MGKLFLPALSIAFILDGLGFDFARAANLADVDNAAYWMCRSAKRVRTVRVHIDEIGNCATLYSKDGVEKVVGSGKNRESCLNIMSNVKTNLEKSGKWTCRDISSSRMSAGVE